MLPQRVGVMPFFRNYLENGHRLKGRNKVLDCSYRLGLLRNQAAEKSVLAEWENLLYVFPIFLLQAPAPGHRSGPRGKNMVKRASEAIVLVLPFRTMLHHPWATHSSPSRGPVASSCLGVYSPPLSKMGKDKKGSCPLRAAAGLSVVEEERGIREQKAQKEARPFCSRETATPPPTPPQYGVHLSTIQTTQNFSDNPSLPGTGLN